MSRLRTYIVLVLLTMALGAYAQQPPEEALPVDTLHADTLTTASLAADSIAAASLPALAIPAKRRLRDRLGKFGQFFGRVIDFFDDIDSSYIEPIAYNFTAMAQATTNFERYTVGTDDYGESISFVQRPDLRIGPYFGWRWLFLGYTYDMTNLGNSKYKRGDKFEFSLYSSAAGADLIWRRTGSDFYLSRVHGLGEEARQYEGQDFNDYISTKMFGVSAYYVFNHRKFSHPAIYSQSTIQRRSAGTWQLGFSITSHDIEFDYEALPKEMFSEIQGENRYATLERVKFMDYSINVGYAYNWVFARGWCMGISLLPAIGYKSTQITSAVVEGNDSGTGGSFFSQKIDEYFRKRGNLNFDVTGRAGVIYNTGRWFTGLFGIVHNYNYRRDDMVFTNIFGTINLCGGFYFQKRKR
ncbi:MAG: DUF4421 domain-containing protein [Bacteroidaceae bacterium]|nr:DUF4421 domain-containing protein [Bacteroidaceae bacterium]